MSLKTLSGAALAVGQGVERQTCLQSSTGSNVSPPFPLEREFNFYIFDLFTPLRNVYFEKSAYLKHTGLKLCNINFISVT